MTHRPRSWLGSGSGGLCQQHVQLFAPADPGGLETGGERRMRADERRDVAFEKIQPVGRRFMDQVDACRPVDAEDTRDLQRRAANPLGEIAGGERRAPRRQQILA